MRYATGAFRLVLLGLYTLLILFFIYAIFPLMGWRKRAAVARKLARGIPKILGIDVTIKGKLPDPGAARGWRDNAPGYMVCANHISFVDIFLVDSILPVHFVAKKEIASWPLFGAITTGVGTIYIDRKRKRAVLEVSETMEKTMTAGENVLFFPEGTTGPGDALLPFHANLFMAAVAAKTEVLPVAIRYTQHGQTSTIPSYANRALFDVLKTIVFTPGLGAEVTLLPTISALTNDRRTLNAEASRSMAEALGMMDATAAEQAVLDRQRAQRLAKLRANVEADTETAAATASV